LSPSDEKSGTRFRLATSTGTLWSVVDGAICPGLCLALARPLHRSPVGLRACPIGVPPPDPGAEGRQASVRGFSVLLGICRMKEAGRPRRHAWRCRWLREVARLRAPASLSFVGDRGAVGQCRLAVPTHRATDLRPVSELREGSRLDPAFCRVAARSQPTSTPLPVPRLQGASSR
jgi:hypothetical protein